MLGYFYFSYLIRIVVFFNQYRALDCCTVLLGKVFPADLVVVTYFVALSAVFFSFLVVGLVLQRGCEYLLLGVDNVRYFVLYCFCSPCCDHCAGFWVTALVYCLCGWCALVSLPDMTWHVHCVTLIQKSGAQILFDHPVDIDIKVKIQYSSSYCSTALRVWPWLPL